MDKSEDSVAQEELSPWFSSSGKATEKGRAKAKGVF